MDNFYYAKEAMCCYKSTLFITNKDEWEHTGKSIKNTLYIYQKVCTSPVDFASNSEKSSL